MVGSSRSLSSCEGATFLSYRILAAMPLSAMAFASTMAPRIEVYTQLACAVHSPDVYNDQAGQSPHVANFVLPSNSDVDSLGGYSELVFDTIETRASTGGRSACASDPVVLAEVAKLSASQYLSSVCSTIE